MLFPNLTIESLSIQSNVIQISSRAFEDCKYLRSIEFQKKNSELRIIEENAFTGSSIKNINFPAQHENLRIYNIK